MSDIYKQCTLIKKSGIKTFEDVCWIPEKFAILNSILTIKNQKGIWEDGWRVTQAGIFGSKLEVLTEQRDTRTLLSDKLNPHRTMEGRLK